MTQKEMMKQMMEMMEKQNKDMQDLKDIAIKLDKRVTALEKGKVSAKKQTAKTEEAPKTRREAIDEWCQKKGYTEEDRKKFGESKKAERELQKKAYEMTNAQFTEKVEYRVWKKQYEANLEALKAGVIK